MVESAAAASKAVAYFHGMPGGLGEWAINAPSALRDTAWLADRNDPAETVMAIAARLMAEFPRGVRVIGFSVGVRGKRDQPDRRQAVLQAAVDALDQARRPPHASNPHPRTQR